MDGKELPDEYCNVIVAREMGIPYEKLSKVPRLLYNLYLQTYLAEKEAELQISVIGRGM